LPREVKKSIKANVDLKTGVISTDNETKVLFEEFCKEYKIDIKNANIVVTTTK
jgi:hypothetical protein